MEKMKYRLSKWLLALLMTVLAVIGLAGCSSQDVETALDVAIEVLEAAESLEAMEADAQGENEETISISDSETIEETQAVSEEPETEAAVEEPTDEEPTDTEAANEEPVIDENGHYTSKDEVALYIHTYGKLPSNFISKREAEELGWKKKDGEAGQLHVVAPGMSIGGSKFGNYEGLLPEAKGRKYYECDINYVKGNRGAERIVYSNDGLIFYTGDHYESFEQLYPAE